MELIYLLVAMLSTTIGAVSGLGGGVIIKPVLDVLGQHDVVTIGLLSSFTVLSMATVSTVRQHRAGIRFDRKRTAFIVLGSIFGGLGGEFLFSSMVAGIKQILFITAFQSLILAVLLTLVLVYLTRKNIQNHDIHNRGIILAAGFLLGLTAAFLGVGGGPFNVVLLSLLFSMDTKSASVHSLLIIFFSQSAKLISVMTDAGFSEYNLSALVFMIPGGILGGVIGTGLNRKLEGETIQLLFKIIVSAIILLNLFTLIKCIDAL